MQRHTAEVAGEKVAWEEAGNGPPVVLIHGIPTGPALWRRVVPLIDEARCLAFEMLGYANSIEQGAAHDISVAAQAARLTAWMDELDIDRAVLVGHDLGGGVAQIAAVNQPDRCAGLVLTNSIGYDSWPIPSVKAMRALSGVVARMPKPLFRRVLAGFVHVGHDDADMATESARLHVEPYLRHDGAAAFVRQIRSLRVDHTLAIADRLPEVEVPARLVWGAADRFQKVGYGERLARDLRADLTRLEDAKHFVPEDHPESIVSAVRDVLAMKGSRH